MNRIQPNLSIASLALLATISAATEANRLPESQPPPQARIIGGQEAPRGAWPWVVGLIDADIENAYWGQFCGGALIDRAWVVTAAHCTIGESPETIDIVVGVHHLSEDLANGIGRRVGVRRIVAHPEYDNLWLYNDIALLQLEAPVTDYSPAPLYTGSAALEGLQATILGWGDTDPSWRRADFPVVLQQVELPIVSNDTCRDVYGGDLITDDMLCAGYEEGGRDACQADSGGPLLVPIDGTWKLAGITSWGVGCARPERYGIYTRVANYRDFIGNAIATDYFACADVNGDGQVDDLDMRLFGQELISDYQDWLETCLWPQAPCGQINDDELIDNRDKLARVLRLRSELSSWRKTCWLPER